MAINDIVKIDIKDVIVSFEDKGVERFGMDAVLVSLDYTYKDQKYQIRIPYNKLQDKLDEYDIG